tara:strand:- start:1309 stop:1506 length:198 start_codon:yes stop_codon:yes gene_type:complete
MESTENNLKAIISKMGVKQKWVAERVGTTQSLLSLWVNNKKQPKIGSLLKLSTALNCTIEEMYNG